MGGLGQLQADVHRRPDTTGTRCGSRVTFALVAVPLKLAAALGVALLLNRERRGVGLFRGLFYLPSLLGGSVALALVWVAMFNRDGAFNALPGAVRHRGQALGQRPGLGAGDPDGAGDLAVRRADGHLPGRPQADPDRAVRGGVGRRRQRWRQFLHVTLPMLSPVIFFNLVLETIHGFQGFTAAFVVSSGTGGPVDSTLMYTLNLYIKGFTDFEMGYASAMAWVFLVAIGLITVVLLPHRPVLGPLLRRRGHDDERRVRGSASRRAGPARASWRSCSTRCSGWWPSFKSPDRDRQQHSVCCPSEFTPGNYADGWTSLGRQLRPVLPQQRRDRAGSRSSATWCPACSPRTPSPGCGSALRGVLVRRHDRHAAAARPRADRPAVHPVHDVRLGRHDRCR